MMENPRLPSAVFVVSIEQVEEVLRRLFLEYVVLPQQQQLRDKMLAPAEVAKLFSPPVSVGTLSNWGKKGLLTKYHIGGRTYYKYAEVMEAIKTLKKYKSNNHFKP